MIDETLLAIYGRDEKFRESVINVQVSDGEIALHCVDGHFADILDRGSYTYWNLFSKHTFQMISLSDENPMDAIPKQLLMSIPEPECRKVVIDDFERGFLRRNNRFVKMLLPGEHFIPDFLEYTVDVQNVNDIISNWRRQTSDQNGADSHGDMYLKMKRNWENAVFERDMNAKKRMDSYETYANDENFRASVAHISVPDGHVALHYADGRYCSVLVAGDYVFWNIFTKHTFETIDISDDSSFAKIPKYVLELFPQSVCEKVNAEEWEAVLLYIDGKFSRRLAPGCHYFWKNGRNISCVRFDMRTTQLDVSGQEILTSDKVALRVNFVCSYRISDPEGINTRLNSFSAQIYAAAQLALRELLGNMRFDEVLENKNSIADEVLTLLKRREGELFVEFLSAGMKDIILPGEIREIMNTVLVAEKRAQANVITRREEVASTRSLLNTARLMDENVTLYKLKELEYLERICDKVGNIEISGASNLLDQLGSIMCRG
jgi:regulator of protease activity HflC (stomatin/prohibitin superfamily)